MCCLGYLNKCLITGALNLQYILSFEPISECFLGHGVVPFLDCWDLEFCDEKVWCILCIVVITKDV